MRNWSFAHYAVTIDVLTTLALKCALLSLHLCILDKLGLTVAQGGHILAASAFLVDLRKSSGQHSAKNHVALGSSRFLK
jgi:hypothetical protein